MPLLSLALCCLSFGAVTPPTVENGVVYREEGRFGGWPANHGIWSWGNEILVGFSRGTYKDLGPSHHIDRDKPEEIRLARSLDGGKTWTVEEPQPRGALIGTKGMRHGQVPPGYPPEKPTPLETPIDFTHPDFAMTLRMEDVNSGTSRFYYSYDRGRTWKGPYLFPLLGQSGIMARTDYVVNGPKSCLVVLTAAKSKGREGRPLCAETTDGGLTWKLKGFIGPEPTGYAIMPSTVRVGPRSLVSTIRLKSDGASRIDAWSSDDDGATWKLLSIPEPEMGEGNPPSLLKLRDGRLCLIHGYRAKPFGIRARLSSDDGKTWTEPIILRDDGGGRDIGYVRSVQRPDGKIVAIYYYHDKTSPTRFIGMTIWDPSKP